MAVLGCHSRINPAIDEELSVTPGRALKKPDEFGPISKDRDVFLHTPNIRLCQVHGWSLRLVLRTSCVSA